MPCCSLTVCLFNPLTLHTMNKLITVFFLLIVAFGNAQATVQPFTLETLTWKEVAESLTTLDKKGIPLSFVGGVSLDCGTALEAPFPLPVSIVIDQDVDFKSLQLLRWDGSLNKWMRFAGNGISREMNDIDGAVSFTIQKGGLYALFSDDHPTGKVEITLPKNHACITYRFTQDNTQVVAQGKGTKNGLTLPIAFASPRARLELECRDENGKSYTIDAPFGELCQANGAAYYEASFSCQIKPKQLVNIALFQ